MKKLVILAVILTVVFVYSCIRYGKYIIDWNKAMMKKDVHFGTRYFCLGTGLLLLFLISRGFLTSHGWMMVERYLPEYTIMECIILTVAFFHKRIRSIALLTEILYLTFPIINIFFCYAHLDTEREDLLYCLHMFYTITFICCWYYGYLKRKDSRQITIACVMSIMFPYIINSTFLPFWSYVLSGQSPYLVTTTCLSIIACTLGCLLCRCKTIKTFLMTAACAIVITIWSALYLSFGIETYLIYGTFTGKTKEVPNIELTDKEHRKVNLKDMDTPYTVGLVWNIDIRGNAYFWVKDFEKLKDMYFNNRSFSFILLATSLKGYQNEDEPFELHKKELFNVPVLKVENNEQFQKELKTWLDIDAVCIFKKDTLIYKNSLLHTSRFLKTLQ